MKSQTKEEPQETGRHFRNFIHDNAIQRDIPKDLLLRIFRNEIAPKPEPTTLLDQQTKFTEFLDRLEPMYRPTFRSVYEGVDKFRLMHLGDYYGNLDNNYIIFSELSLSFLNRNKEKKKTIGFCLKLKHNIYIGQFEDMRPHGEGIALFWEEKDRNGMKENLYHEFKGSWKRGEIMKGTRVTYREEDTQLREILNYTGKFRNFQFEDQEGVLIRRGKKLVGIFQRGFCKQQLNSKPSPNANPTSDPANRQAVDQKVCPPSANPTTL